jgi:hypothetical protein
MKITKSKLKNTLLNGIEIIAFISGITGCVFSMLGLFLFILPIEILNTFSKWIWEETSPLLKVLGNLIFFTITLVPLIFFFISLFGMLLGFISYKLAEKKSAKFAIYLNMVSLILSLAAGIVVFLLLSKAAW